MSTQSIQTTQITQFIVKPEARAAVQKYLDDGKIFCMCRGKNTSEWLEAEVSSTSNGPLYKCGNTHSFEKACSFFMMPNKIKAEITLNPNSYIMSCQTSKHLMTVKTVKAANSKDLGLPIVTCMSNPANGRVLHKY